MTKTEEWDRCTRVLGLQPEAGLNEIQAAYRRLVLKYHPDINHTLKAPVRFREIVEAYGTILDFVRAKADVSGEELYTAVKKDPLVRKMKFEELENRFKYSSSPRLRTSALIALEMHRDERTKKLLFDALRDESDSVQLAALDILEKTCCVRDLPKLFMSLAGLKNRKVRSKLFCMIFKTIKNSPKNPAAQGEGIHREEEMVC